MKIVKEISKFEIICHTKRFNKDILDLHWHERYELCQVLQNDCGFIVDGQMISARVGDIIAVNENKTHSTDGGISKCLIIRFGRRAHPAKEGVAKSETERADENGADEQEGAHGADEFADLLFASRADVLRDDDLPRAGIAHRDKGHKGRDITADGDCGKSHVAHHTANDRHIDHIIKDLHEI